MDNQILRDLFAQTAAAAKSSGGDAGFRAGRSSARAKLAADRIGAGQLQEWREDWDGSARNNHRHVSHLYAVHPSAQITRAERLHWRAPRGRRSKRAATKRPAGRSPGASTCGRGCTTATARTPSLELLLSPDRSYPEPVRRAPAVPDRRKLRRHRGDRRNAVAVASRPAQAVAGAAARVARAAASPASAHAAASRLTWPGRLAH